MNPLTRRWRRTAIALLAAFSTLFLANTSAYAYQPGESGTWQQETAGGTRIQTASGLSEARSENNVLVQVWQTFNNNVRISVNHGPAIDMPGATTYADPQVIWITDNGPTSVFWVFHTGTNGSIYYTPVSATPNDQTYTPQGIWNQVPHGAATPNNFRVAAGTLPNRSAYITFRGASSNEVWGMFFDGTSNRWFPPGVLPGIRSDHAPAITTGWRHTFLLNTVINLQGQPEIIRQDYGSGTWQNRHTLPAVLGDDIQVAISGTGRGQVAVRYHNLVDLATIDEYGNMEGNWDQEITAHIAYHFNLFAYAAAVYLVTSYGNGYADWKQSRQF